MDFLYSKWIEKLKNASEDKSTVIIVEGKRDREKLKKLGIKNIYPIRGKKFYDILEELENEELVILLTDLDKQGDKIAEKLTYLFQREGIPVDNSFREYLRNSGIKHIEDLPLKGEKDAGKENYPLP